MASSIAVRESLGLRSCIVGVLVVFGLHAVDRVRFKVYPMLLRS